jgi:hypothetical protein
MYVLDARSGHVLGELGFGETRPATMRQLADIHEDLDISESQILNKIFDSPSLVAYRVKFSARSLLQIASPIGPSLLAS